MLSLHFNLDIMKNFLVLFFSFFLSLAAFAQLEFDENSFKKVDGFVNLSDDKQNDHNDKPYAVLKVRTENINGILRRELDFKGNPGTFLEVEYKEGEVWLYISYYVSYLNVSHKEMGMTEFWFPFDMEPKCGYELTLVKKIDPNNPQMDVYNYLIVKADLPDADIYIDNEIVGQQQAYKSFKAGEKHTWRIERAHCHGESGEVVIPSEKDTNVTIDKVLRQILVDVSIQTGQDADIYVDNVLIGHGKWSGQIMEGPHVIEARKDAHRTVSKNVDMVFGKAESFVLPSPVPIYGTLDISTDPKGVDIFIDGVKCGVTPQKFKDVLVGNHELKLVIEGCTPVVKEIYIVENQKVTVKETVPTSFIIRENGIFLEMMPVKGGTFSMGRSDKDAPGGERPAHNVTLNDYYISKYEVTQDLWDFVMGSKNTSYDSKDMPVSGVSYNDVRAFIRKLVQMTGKNFRLPTEAEWEFAAKGGNKSKGYKFSGKDIIEMVAWCKGNSANYIHPVGQLQPNELGIYDMTGNVKEWCSDLYGNYSSEKQTNPQGSETGTNHVMRGGGFDESRYDSRVTTRSSVKPDNRDSHNGFRLVYTK